MVRWRWLLMAVTMASVAVGQEPKSVRVEVEGLVRQLDAPHARLREAAEKRLIELGPQILPWLPSPKDTTLSAEQRLRLQRIIRHLNLRLARQQLDASRVTLEGRYRLSHILNELQRQTGNRIRDRRHELGQPARDPELEVHWQAKPFWEAILELCRRAQLRPVVFGSSDGLVLLAGREVSPYRHVAGALLVSAERITLVRDFTLGRAASTLEVVVAWEPRIKVIRVELALGELEAVDDQGRSLAVELPGAGQVENLRGVPSEGEMAVLIGVPLGVPAPGASKIGVLHLPLRVMFSGSTRQMRIGPLRERQGDQASPATVQIPEARLELLQVREELGVWRIQTRVTYASDDSSTEPLTESYEDWFLQTKAFLVHRQRGERFDLNGGYNLLATGDRSYAVEYLFVDVPGDLEEYDLVVEIPARPMWVPVDVTLRDIPLPVRQAD